MTNPIERSAESYLEERVRHLEGVERFVIDSLEVAASLGDFQSSINRLHDVSTILEKTGGKVKSLITFESVAFYLVNEQSNEFELSYIDSENQRSSIQGEVDRSIDDGVFAWALRERRPVVVSAKSHQKSLVLHSMSSASRIRGMFIGLLDNDVRSIQNISLSLVSFILFNSANAIESFELYRKIREINGNLELELTERRRAEEALEEERRRLQQALDEIKTLRGIVPICAYCKKIRDDEGYWNQVEQYISVHTEAKFSHGICPACFEREMKELKSE